MNLYEQLLFNHHDKVKWVASEKRVWHYASGCGAFTLTGLTVRGYQFWYVREYRDGNLYQSHQCPSLAEAHWRAEQWAAIAEWKPSGDTL